MKKVKKLLIILGILVVLAVIAVFVIGRMVSSSYEKLDSIPVVELKNVNDGVYEGAEETLLVKVTVRVTVENHEIKNIELLRHVNGKGQPAENMLDEMVKNDTGEVDEVSGATMSSKTIKAAVRNALAKGIK